jgi:hypothetical protein
MEPLSVAEKVIEYGENEDYEKILNIAATNDSEQASVNSPLSLLRKLYLKLSLIIHPDRIGNKHAATATKAFQAVVKAFEYLSNPASHTVSSDETSSSSSRRTRGATAAPENPLQISRSNENCYRTRILCPRCKLPWNEGSLDGNPDYCYNLIMSGLKQFTCSTCLFEFGCMTAIHLCPFCKKSFYYSPKDYHSQLTCPRENCCKKFGFYLYHISDRKIKELKQSIKDEILTKIKAKETKQRRAQRFEKRTGGSSDLTSEEKEKAFLLGLSDCCPRCGEDFTEYNDEELLNQHLMECLDEIKHEIHAKKQTKQLVKLQKKEEKKQKEDDYQIYAGWQLLGAKSSQLYLLNEDHLKEEAQRKGIKLLDEGKGTSDKNMKRKRGISSKEDLIAKLVEYENGDLDNSLLEDSKKDVIDLIEDGDDDNDDDEDYMKERENGKKGKKQKSSSSSALVVADKNALVRSKRGENTASKKKKRLNPDDLPSNLYSLSIEQLKSFCISNGLKNDMKKNPKKSDLIELIEEELLS